MTAGSRPLATRARRTRTIATIAVAVALIVLAIAWTVTPIARVLDARTMAMVHASMRDWPFAPLVVVAVYVVAGLIVTPVTLLIGATLLLFGPRPGALYGYLGMMASAVVVYAIGRFAARELIDDWLAKRADSRLDAFNRRLERRGLLAVALTRLTPVPFSLQNLAMGASRIGFVDFVVGTAIGIVPIIALMAGFATQLESWLRRPDAASLFVWVVAAIVICIGGWLVRRRALRSGVRRE